MTKTKDELEIEKLLKENEKAELEIKALKRSPFELPGTWISIILAFTTVGGVIGSNMISEYKVAKAELEALEKTEAANERVEVAREEVENANRLKEAASRQASELRQEALVLAAVLPE